MTKAKKEEEKKGKTTTPPAKNAKAEKTSKPAVNEAEKTGYNDEELEEFKQIILEKLDKAEKDLELLTEAFTHKNEHDINDTSPTFKVLEEGYQVLSKEENSKLAARQHKFIKSLENALIRIENKSYGICRETGKLIPKERLRVVPHATLSMEAKTKQKR